MPALTSRGAASIRSVAVAACGQRHGRETRHHDGEYWVIQSMSKYDDAGVLASGQAV